MRKCHLRFPLVILAAVVAVCSTATPASASDGGGGRIVWTQFVDTDFSASRLVWSNPDGSDLVELTHPPRGSYDIDAEISPDGTRIVFTREDNAKNPMYTVRTDGTGLRKLDFGCADPCAGDFAATWAARGRLVFTRVVGPFDNPGESAASAVLFSAKPDGSELRRFSEPGIDGIFEDYFANFSPDGSYVTFMRVRNRDFGSAIFRMRPDATGVRQLTPWSLEADLPDLSQATRGPGADLVAFETYGHGAPDGKRQNVATVPATCTSLADCTAKIRYITHHTGDVPTQAFNPTMSPDGTRIAFTRYFDRGPDGAKGNIWTTGINGDDTKQVSGEPLFDYRPDWGAT